MKKLLEAKKISFVHSALCGFTLAEVILTLVIVGIIAAFTIPALIAEHQKQEYVARLKKTYSTMSNGFRIIMANTNCTDLACTGLFSDGIPYAIPGGSHNLPFVTNLMKQNPFNAKYCGFVSDANGRGCFADKYRTLKGLSAAFTIDPFGSNGHVAFQNLDGAAFAFYVMPGCSSNSYGYNGICSWLKIDVNGKKLPNQRGRDYFEFLILSNGQIAPSGSSDDYNPWATTCKNPEVANSSGLGCAARIMQDNWQMNY